jgi:ribonuclease D
MGPRADAAQNDGGASAARVDGKTDRQSARDQNERGIALERAAVIGMTSVIASGARLHELLKKIDASNRVAVDTEADSLHSYREKLCLIQISVPSAVLRNGEKSLGTASKVEQRDSSTSLGMPVQSVCDFIVDPLSNLDVEPLRQALEPKEIVLQGADYDLRMLRRGLNFSPTRIFDTVIAARLLGIREFSLGALVKRFFGVELHKHSQKANWAVRPLPPRMTRYAVNDVHYLLPLAGRLEQELKLFQRVDWFRQSCERAIELATITRERSSDDIWRIPGAGALHPHSAAVLRALWHWREAEAEISDRPPFHVLQNQELLKAAVDFASHRVPDYKQFSARRRHTFREAAKIALQSPQSDWPVMRRRSGSRPTAASVRRAEKLRERRDKSADQLGLEPSFVASRGALEAIAADPSRTATLLVPWQRRLLAIV